MRSAAMASYRPLSITKIDPPVPVSACSEPLVRTVVHMMESVALPGGSGMKAAIKATIAIKTGTSESETRWPPHQL